MTLAARIRRLSVAFHERTILHDIALDIPAEGITVLLGRSGSGKTTFLRALNRLNECLPGCRTSGEAELRLGGGLRPIYAGRTGEAALSDLRRRVGMVFQTPNILPASIRQNMLLPLQLATAFPASEWRERMERSLTEVGLWHDVSSRLREPASILSGVINHKITEKEKRDNLGRRGIYFWQECNFVAEYVIEKEWGAPPF